MILGFVVAINLPSKLLVKWQGLLRFIYIGLGYNQTEKSMYIFCSQDITEPSPSLSKLDNFNSP